MRNGCSYGTHRVIEPEGLLPQPAWKIDNNMEIYDNEVLIDVEVLNIDSASFTQIEEEAGGDETRIAEIMIGIVKDRGKHHNPVTGSGGMLIGRVEKIGTALEGKTPLKVNQRLATLVSLSLTPLRIDRIRKIHKDIDQVEIDGKAILFESGIYAVLPDDLPQTLSLAILDVAGAAAQTAKLVKPGDKVVIIGAGGKSGLLCLHEARKRAGVTGQVIGIAPREASKKRAESTGCCDVVLMANAADALDVMNKVKEATGGTLADVTINCVNIPNTELSSILATRDGGLVYYFSMATSFTAAALGAEGVGKDVTMIIGNGYTTGHAAISLNIMHESPILRKIFEELYT
ncbi:MAG: L-erythro-3,5-diaminohexanoate dehydrogenase [Clostridia bacterium]|nr:L-erythro-3,5-diaminohexanoate dehydrogenase [Clostridia bacterium]